MAALTTGVRIFDPPGPAAEEVGGALQQVDDGLPLLRNFDDRQRRVLINRNSVWVCLTSTAIARLCSPT